MSAADILKDGQIVAEILNLIRTARQKIIIVSPYNRHGPALKRELENARSRGVEVEMYYREGEEDPAQDYLDIGVNSFPVFWLHAKIYANEEAVIITSQNLTERSGENARDIGLLVRDADLYHETLSYVRTLRSGGQNLAAGAQNGVRQDRTEPVAASPAPSRNQVCLVCANPQPYDPEKPLCLDCWNSEKGFCIRCGKTLPRDFERVLCRFPCWQYHRSERHRRCHLCGQDAATGLDDTLCEKCFLGLEGAGLLFKR